MLLGSSTFRFISTNACGCHLGLKKSPVQSLEAFQLVIQVTSVMGEGVEENWGVQPKGHREDFTP